MSDYHSLPLELWLRKRSQDYYVRLHAGNEIRRRMRQNYTDYSRRGKGNRAQRRAARIAIAARLATIDPGALAAYILAVNVP